MPAHALSQGKAVQPLIDALKGLQDNLGDFNDFGVQQETLRRFARQMAEEGEVPVETLMAMGRLISRLEEGEEAERRRFHEMFDRFARTLDAAAGKIDRLAA